MRIDAISTPRTVEIHWNDGTYKAYSPYTEENDMVYECSAFADALERGDKVDAEAYLRAFTIMDEVRKQVGICYPADLK